MDITIQRCVPLYIIFAGTFMNSIIFNAEVRKIAEVVHEIVQLF